MEPMLSYIFFDLSHLKHMMAPSFITTFMILMFTRNISTSIMTTILKELSKILQPPSPKPIPHM